jgi:hypothetical protein
MNSSHRNTIGGIFREDQARVLSRVIPMVKSSAAALLMVRMAVGTAIFC